VTSTRYWWSPGKQCRRSSVRPAVTQRGETRDFGLKTPRLTLGLKFRSDKNISKWPPEAVAAPHPGRKMSPFVRRRAVRRRCCASDPWRAPSSIRSNLVFRRDRWRRPSRRAERAIPSRRADQGRDCGAASPSWPLEEICRQKMIGGKLQISTFRFASLTRGTYGDGDFSSKVRAEAWNP
jgi:hypothetical protein